MMKSNILSKTHSNTSRSGLHFRIRKEKAFALCIAASCAALYASFPVEIFPDRPNYLAYASGRSELLIDEYLSRGLHILIFNEPLWLYLNLFMSKFFDPEAIIRTIIFIPAFIIYYFGISRTGPWFIFFIMFTINPIFSTNHLMHLRFGLALSIFCMGFYFLNPKVKWPLIAISALFHSAFLIIIAIYSLVEASKQIRQLRLMILFLFLSIGLLFSLSFQFAASLVTQADRYYGQITDVGGGQFVVFLSVLVLFLWQRKTFLKEHAFAISILGFYIAIYWIFPYPRRFLDAGILFILITGLNLPRYPRCVFIAIMGFLLLYFLYDRWHLPYFGMARYLTY